VVVEIEPDHLGMHRSNTNFATITFRKIRLALVGCGRISANHFDSIEKHASHVELVDVCDNNIAALDLAVARTKAKGKSNLTELLETTTADLIVLSTPSGLHPDQAIQVAQSGRHVITEKPMATNWSDLANPKPSRPEEFAIVGDSS